MIKLKSKNLYAVDKKAGERKAGSKTRLNRVQEKSRNAKLK